MFSGIIETTGTITKIDTIAEGVRLRLQTNLLTQEISLGESICTNGACLTVTAIEADQLSFDVSAESLRRATLGELQVDDSVNLERSLRLEDRLSGHLVWGHVDGVGRVTSIKPEGDSFLYTFALPAELSRYLVEKGSVAVDGISLTVFDCQPTAFTCAIIPPHPHGHHATSAQAR